MNTKNEILKEITDYLQDWEKVPVELRDRCKRLSMPMFQKFNLEEIKNRLNDISCYNFDDLQLVHVWKDPCKNSIEYMLVSNNFEKVDEGYMMPELILNRESLNNDTHQATDQNICQHHFEMYTGLSESFEYCTICGKRK